MKTTAEQRARMRSDLNSPFGYWNRKELSDLLDDLDAAQAALGRIVPENFAFEGQNLRGYSAKGHMECVKIAQAALAGSEEKADG